MKPARAAALAALIAAAGCSKRAAAHYKNCLTLRVDMTKADMLKIMGAPDAVLPYIEGTTPDYLKGRTAYEWSNPADMPSGDHVSVDDGSGKIESIRCAGTEIASGVLVEPPATSRAAAPAAGPASPAKAAPPPVLAAGRGTLEGAVAAFRRKDLRLALKIVNPLAGAGDPQAELLLGLVFFTAEDAGLQSNVDEALRWFYQASRQNNCEAAALYAATIKGRAPSKTVAAETALAASQGCASGKLLQAAMLLQGYEDIVAADVSAGEELLLSAAQDGSARAQLDLGRRLGAKKDLVGAYRWTLLASRHPLVDKFADPLNGLSNVWRPEDRAETETRLAELRRSMTPAQIAQATSLAAR